MIFGGFWKSLAALKAWVRPPVKIDFPWQAFEFAVSTTTGLYLCTRSRWHRLLDGRHYGLTFTANAMFCFQEYDGRGRIVRIDRDGRCRIVVAGLPQGSHILDTWEGRLYDADRRRIRVFDLSNWEETDLLGPVPFHEDDCDISGILFRDGKTYVVCDKGGVVVGDRAFQPEADLTVPSDAPHNIAFLGERLLTCDRDGRQLVDLAGPVAHFDGVPRGLAVTGDTVAVGVSSATDGRIVFLDHGFSPTGTLDIPGVIHEVRALFRPDGGLSTRPDSPD